MSGQNQANMEALLRNSLKSSEKVDKEINNCLKRTLKEKVSREQIKKENIISLWWLPCTLQIIVTIAVYTVLSAVVYNWILKMIMIMVCISITMTIGLTVVTFKYFKLREGAVINI